MDLLLNNTIQYLREKAVYLLEPDKQPVKTFYAPSKQGFFFMPGFREIESLVALLPQMLLDLEYQASNNQMTYNVYSPAKARPSKNPTNYWYSEGQLIPKIWKRSANKVDSKPYEWLLGLLTRRLIPYMEKTFQQVAAYEDEIKSNRSGISTFAKVDDTNLRQYFERIERTLLAAKRTVFFIRNNITENFIISDSPPYPAPASPSWHYAIELIRRWYKPENYVKDTLNEISSMPIDMASLPFLYQRYVGLRLVESLQFSGWHRITPDKFVMVACFIGGVIEFTKGTARLSLWCEPRLNKNHPSGFTSAHTDEKFEQTPEYLIVMPTHNGKLDGYILDATLQSSHNDLTTKAAKYITEQHGRYIGIQQQRMIKIAGCNAINKPLRSWVISPNVNKYDNQLLSHDGVFGIIPVDPRNYDPDALNLFIKDIGATV